MFGQPLILPKDLPKKKAKRAPKRKATDSAKTGTKRSRRARSR